MKVDSITDRIDSDIFGWLECEHCENQQEFKGYDDALWHLEVLPVNYYCDKCGKNSNGDIDVGKEMADGFDKIIN